MHVPGKTGLEPRTPSTCAVICNHHVIINTNAYTSPEHIIPDLACFQSLLISAALKSSFLMSNKTSRTSLGVGPGQEEDLDMIHTEMMLFQMKAVESSS